MKKASLISNLTYNETKPAIQVLFETPNSKEIRIAMRANQVMNEHKTSYPIVVEIFDGEIDFGVYDETHHLIKGDVLALEANVPHDLVAITDSTVRLTLSKSDTVFRVESVANEND